MKVWIIGAISCAALGCGVDPVQSDRDVPISDVLEGVRHGLMDSGSAYPDVVALYFVDPATGFVVGLCSGTLVQPTRVLTAAHCVQGFTGDIYVVFDAGYRQVTTVRIHPLYASNYYVATHPWVPGNHQVGLSEGADLATVDFAVPIPVTPRVIAPSPVPWGQIVKGVGFGEIATGVLPAQRRWGVEIVDVLLPFVTNGTVVMPNGTVVLTPWSLDNVMCPGDSGGPAINANGQVAAVQSFTSFQGSAVCDGGTANSLSMTHDFRSWILEDPVQPLPHHNYALPPDVNNDGYVSGFDVITVINAVSSGGGVNGCSSFCDTNADGVLTDSDAQYVIDVLSRSDSAGYTITPVP